MQIESEISSASTPFDPQARVQQLEGALQAAQKPAAGGASGDAGLHAVVAGLSLFLSGPVAIGLGVALSTWDAMQGSPSKRPDGQTVSKKPDAVNRSLKRQPARTATASKFAPKLSTSAEANKTSMLREIFTQLGTARQTMEKPFAHAGEAASRRLRHEFGKGAAHAHATVAQTSPSVRPKGLHAGPSPS
jgi:hypothetical protein